METLIAQTLSTTALMALFLSAWVLIVYLIYLWGKRSADQFRQYDTLYRKINIFIFNLPRTKGNYDLIFDEIDTLIHLKYKDDEQSEVLLNLFLTEWNKVKDEIVAEVRGNA